MTFFDTEMKKLDRRTKQNIRNTRSLICAPQVCLRHLADRRSFHSGRIYTLTHTHTQRRTNTRARVASTLVNTQYATGTIYDTAKASVLFQRIRSIK